jgi:hypothetical protein
MGSERQPNRTFTQFMSHAHHPILPVPGFLRFQPRNPRVHALVPLDAASSFLEFC